VTSKLRVNPIACSGHGLCAELLPELISLDEWGYPVIADYAVPDCPALALRVAPGGGAARGRPAGPGPSRPAA